MNTPSSIWGAQPPRPSAIYPFQGAWPYHLKIASDGSGMVTTSPLLRSQQQNVINLLWPNSLKGPSLSLLLLVSSMYVMCLSWCSARNARCGGYCSPRRLSSAARQQLATTLESLTFTCSASLLDLELPAYLSNVCVRDLQCYDQVEKLYYSMNYDPICIHCSSEDNLQTAEGYYPQYRECNEKERVPKQV